MELAMIGLGRMGANMAERLVRAGHRVAGVSGRLVIDVGRGAFRLFVRALGLLARLLRRFFDGLAALFECLEAGIRHKTLQGTLFRTGNSATPKELHPARTATHKLVPPFRPSRCYGRARATEGARFAACLDFSAV